MFDTDNTVDKKSDWHKVKKKIGNVELWLGDKKKPAIVGVVRDLSISKVRKAKKGGADIIELRIDLFKEKERSIEKIREFVKIEKEELNLPIIATNRRKEEGGGFKGTEEERVDLLAEIIDGVNIDAIDIEFLAERKREIIEKAKKAHLLVILSYHNFNGMPRREDMIEIVEKMYEGGGDIAKIAVTPETLSDALFLLQLVLNTSMKGKSLAVIGMGHIGKHLRIIAPIYGSVLTYGFVEGERGVAPAQLSVNDLKEIYGKISKRAGGDLNPRPTG